MKHFFKLGIILLCVYCAPFCLSASMKAPPRPKKILILKPYALRAHPQQFSGALQWVHKKGIKGHGQTFLVLELEASPGLYDLKRTLKNKLVLPQQLGRLDRENHASDVVNVAHQVAPLSTIGLLLHDNFGEGEITKETFEHEAHSPHLKKVIDDSIAINCSFRNLQLAKSSWSIKLMKFLLNQGSPKLLIRAAGNDGKNLSVTGDDYEEIPDLITNPAISPYLIIAGGVRQNSDHTFNKPGHHQIIQDHYLCTLSEEIYPFSSFDLTQGTSFAAPIITASVALLKEAFPALTVLEIKEVLLESAERNFHIYYPSEKKEPYLGIFIYDPEDGEPDKTLEAHPRYDIRFYPFDPSTYGKGMLSLKNAFIYAKLKTKNKHLSSRDLRKKMKEILKSQENTAASKIQQAFRKHKLA